MIRPMIAARTPMVLSLVTCGSLALIGAVAHDAERPSTPCVTAPPTRIASVDRADDGFHVAANFPAARIGDTEVELDVSVVAPQMPAAARAPVSLVIAIDRSSSMSDAAIAEQRLAAGALIDRLTEDDAVAIVTYAAADETAFAIARLTPAARLDAHAALAGIARDRSGGTCISCGIDRATGELAGSPVIGGVHHVLVMSDGAANLGIAQPGDLLDHVASLVGESGAWTRSTVASREMTPPPLSISTIAIGDGADAEVLRRIAQVGHGESYLGGGRWAVDFAVADDVARLGTAVAAQVVLDVTPAVPGVHVVGVAGYPAAALSATARGVALPVSDLRAGETRDLVLRVRLDGGVTAPRAAVATATLTWRGVGDGGAHAHAASADLAISTGPAPTHAICHLRPPHANDGAAVDAVRAAFERAPAIAR